MGVNVYFNQETHRISQLPVTFKAFIQVLTSLFHDKLPHSWNLWFVDSKGNNRAILHDLEYSQLRNMECTTSCLTIDFFIVPNKSTNIPRPTIPKQEIRSKPNPMIAKQTLIPLETLEQPKFLMEKVLPIQEKDFCFDFENPFNDQIKFETPETWDNGSSEEKQSISYFGDFREDLMDFPSFEDLQEIPDLTNFSQNKWEKTAQAEQLVFKKENLLEVQPRAHLQPQNEGFKTAKMLKAMHLIQKLGTKTLNEGKIRRAFEKIQKIEAILNPEELKELQKVKDHVVINFWKNQKEKKRSLSNTVFEDEDLCEETHKVVLLNNTPNEKTSIRKSVDNLKNAQIMDKSLYLPNEFESFPTFNGKPLHVNVICNGCGTAPLVGIRYKCDSCYHFNFCEICEATKEHSHPFLKIKEPVIENYNSTSLQSNRIELTFEAIKKMMNAIKSKDADKCEKYMNRLFTQFPEETKQIINSETSWNYDKKEAIVSEWKEWKKKNAENKVRKIEVMDLVTKLKAHQESLKYKDNLFVEQIKPFDFVGLPLIDLTS